MIGEFCTREEVIRVKCAWCGETINSDPVWRDEELYCSDECADMGPFEEEEEKWEEEEEKEYR